MNFSKPGADQSLQIESHSSEEVQRPVKDLDLIRTLADVSAQFHPEVPAEWIVKRVQFFAYEWLAQLEEDLPERDRLASLNRYFFVDQSFHCVDVKDFGAASYLLAPVLHKRGGGSLVLAVLYSFLARRAKISLELIDSRPSCYLKWTENKRSRFIDVTRGGSTLSSDELIETLEKRFRMEDQRHEQLFESYTPESYLVAYLMELKLTLNAQTSLESLLFIQNELIKLQPNQLHHLGERAIFHYRLGQYKSALSDLKRFFVFCQREKAPQELRELHDELLSYLGTGSRSTNVELTDW